MENKKRSKRLVSGFNGQKSIYLRSIIYTYFGDTPIGKKVPKDEYKMLLDTVHTTTDQYYGNKMAAREIRADSELRKDLITVFNSRSVDTRLNMPDWAIANFVLDTLQVLLATRIEEELCWKEDQ